MTTRRADSIRSHTSQPAGTGTQKLMARYSSAIVIAGPARSPYAISSVAGMEVFIHRTEVLDAWEAAVGRAA